MRRRAFGFIALAVPSLAAALAAAGCGGSKSATAPDEPTAPRTGAAVITGTIVNGFSASSTGGVRALSTGGGLTVSVVGTPLSGVVDDEGHFTVAGAPSGAVTLRFEGPGVDARLTVSGLVDGQVMSIEIHLSGTSAQVVSQTCTPTKDVEFSGQLESVSGSRLVVGGRNVDTSELKKVWRGERRIQLSDLQVGEKVKVWGTLRADGVVLAEEIAALTRDSESGSETWVSFRGTIESVSFAALTMSSDLGASCTYPTLIVKGTKVVTNDKTAFIRSDKTPYDPGELKVGQQVLVEGWKKSAGWVLATLVSP